MRRVHDGDLEAGAEVVAGDADDPASLERACAGAHGVFAVTNFWEHFSPEREVNQTAAMARASKSFYDMPFDDYLRSGFLAPTTSETCTSTAIPSTSALSSIAMRVRR